MLFILLETRSNTEQNFIQELYDKLNVKLYSISFNMSKNKHDAEDAVANTYIKVANNIKKIMSLPGPQIEPYCVTILKNETINIIRKNTRLIYNVDDDTNGVVISDSFDLEEELLNRLDVEKLGQVIEKLSIDEKNLLYMRYHLEMKFSKIALFLNITEEAAKKRNQRIIKKLKIYYEVGEENE